MAGPPVFYSALTVSAPAGVEAGPYIVFLHRFVGVGGLACRLGRCFCIKMQRCPPDTRTLDDPKKLNQQRGRFLLLVFEKL